MFISRSFTAWTPSRIRYLFWIRKYLWEFSPENDGNANGFWIYHTRVWTSKRNEHTSRWLYTFITRTRLLSPTGRMLDLAVQRCSAVVESSGTWSRDLESFRPRQQLQEVSRLQYGSVENVLSVLRDQKSRLAMRYLRARPCSCRLVAQGRISILATESIPSAWLVLHVSACRDWLSEERWWTLDHGSIERWVSSACYRNICHFACWTTDGQENDPSLLSPVQTRTNC